MGHSSLHITFPLGIPGFEAFKEWKLNIEKDIPLAHLISLKNENIGFVLTRPEIYFPIYLDDLAIDSDGQKVLEIKDDTKLDVWSILFVSQDVMQTSTNLKAPLIFNLSGKLGYQLIRNDERYNSRELLFFDKQHVQDDEGVTG